VLNTVESARRISPPCWFAGGIQTSELNRDCRPP
jgi:hypothetical protein